MKIITAAAFLGCILAANYATTEYGMVPVGFGLVATAGTYLAGVTFILRDAVQDAVRASLPGRILTRTASEPAYPDWATEAAPQLRGLMRRRQVQEWVPSSDWLAALPVMGLILLGGLLSYLIADPFIATASMAAFVSSEVVDLLIYTPLRRRGYIRAAIASNIVGALVDTLLFLWVAGFPIWSAVPGQMVGKLVITLAVVALVAAMRTRRAVMA